MKRLPILLIVIALLLSAFLLMRYIEAKKVMTEERMENTKIGITIE